MGSRWLSENGKLLISSSTGKLHNCASCPCGCPENFEVTTIDIESCLGCRRDVIPSHVNSIEFVDNDSVINGVFTVPQTPFGPPQEPPECAYDSFSGNGLLDYKNYTGSVSACVEPHTDETVNLSITVIVNVTTSQVFFVSLYAFLGTFFYYSEYEDGGTYYLGDSIPNHFTVCGQHTGYQSGTIGITGSAVVDLP